MDLWGALGIGAGLGLLKSLAIDAPKEARQRKVAAATQRYSPWTGLQAQPVQEADPFGSALQFGATGAMLGQGIQNADATKNLQDAMAKYYGQGGLGSYGNYYAGLQSPGLGVDMSYLNTPKNFGMGSY